MPDLFISQCQRNSSVGAAAVTIDPWKDSVVQFVLVVITIFPKVEWVSTSMLNLW